MREAPKLEPNLPQWFKENYITPPESEPDEGELKISTFYSDLLEQELKRIKADLEQMQKIDSDQIKPETPAEENKIIEGLEKQLNIPAEHRPIIREQILESVNRFLTDCPFDHLSLKNATEKINSLLNELKNDLSPDETSVIRKDFAEYFTRLVNRTHLIILRRMANESIPRTDVSLHRTNPQEFQTDTPSFVRKSIQWISQNKTLKRFSLPLRLITKNPSFKIEAIEKNLRRGIGGCEIDIRNRADGELVVSHHGSKKEVEEAPTFEEVLKTVRELIPEDKHRERSARRSLKIFTHLKVKISPKIARQFLALTEKHKLTNRIFIQTGRPENLYEFDRALNDIRKEKMLKSDKKIGRPHFSFKILPLEALSLKISNLLDQAGFADNYHEEPDEENPGSKTEVLRSKFGISEYSPLRISRLRGKILEVLKRNDGHLEVAAEIARKRLNNLVHIANQKGLKINVGVTVSGEDIESFLHSHGKPGATKIEGFGSEAIMPNPKNDRK